MDMVNHKAHAENAYSHSSGLNRNYSVKYEEVLRRVEKVESGNCPLINMHDSVRTKYSSFHIHMDLVSGKSIGRSTIGLSKKEKCDETCVFRDENLSVRRNCITNEPMDRVQKNVFCLFNNKSC